MMINTARLADTLTAIREGNRWKLAIERTVLGQRRTHIVQNARGRTRYWHRLDTMVKDLAALQCEQTLTVNLYDYRQGDLL